MFIVYLRYLWTAAATQPLDMSGLVQFPWLTGHVDWAATGPKLHSSLRQVILILGLALIQTDDCCLETKEVINITNAAILIYYSTGVYNSAVGFKHVEYFFYGKAMAVYPL